MPEVYGPRKTHLLNYVRSISLVDGGGGWDFSLGGTPFPFEGVSQCGVRRKKDRLTFEVPERCLSELCLSPFDEAFYLPDSADPIPPHKRQAAK